jgi:hypothetical protein
MPATAAIDNETLDHLLSITDLALAALGRPAIAMFSTVVKAATAGRYLAEAPREPVSGSSASRRHPQYSIPDQIRTGREGAIRYLVKAASAGLSQRAVLPAK